MKCNAPIDQETKMALAGSALEAALNDPNSLRCGQELTADDVFCPICGARVENIPLSQGASVSCDSGADACEKDIIASPYCKGRSPRSELWKVWLQVALFYEVLSLVVILNSERADLGKSVLAVAGLFVCVIILPVSVRRLHDQGNSGKAMIPSVCFSFVMTLLSLSGNDESSIGALVGIIAEVYNLILFVFLGFLRGAKGPNKYGPDPLEAK